ncbi:MAG: hypothetical protein JWR88_1051 [Pseudonocardia sp.]|nr:hypothetical protein [Pseudonocardia sp.]
MGREIRRVPVGWQHPTEPNPYWREQAEGRRRRGDPPLKLHAPEVHFTPLCDDYIGAVDDHLKERRQILMRDGHKWTFSLAYHLTGYQGRSDAEPVVHPFWVVHPDGSEYSVAVRDESHLFELLLAQNATEAPNPAEYMPVWPEGTELGWCLYQTVSEGSPITPVFPTAEALVEHLCTEGDDWDQTPWRREAAEAMVADGWAPTFVVSDQTGVLAGGRDSDRIATGT